MYFHRNLPIKWVRIVGVVVAVDEFAGRRAFTIDDSSGACIEALIPLTTAPKTASNESDAAVTAAAAAAPVGPLAQPVTPYDHIDVGAVVDVKGALTTFRDAKQLQVEKMTALRGTAAEMKLWAKRAAFRRDVLDAPWILPERTVRRCRKEAERTEAEAERRRRRRLQAASASGSRAGKAKAAPRDGNAAGERRREPTREREDVIEVVAGAKGSYNALGL